MIAPAPSREIVKQLKDAGFTSRDGKGSHTVWTCAHGREQVTVPTGHRTISPAVRRDVNKTIAACETNCKEV
ncbi:putative toxin-antitoxin system protein [Mycobacterium phage HC]|uniref:HicA-like toxin n=2 Tax=Brujitavirus TaxID=2169611 RepID=G8I6R4_9CAUD|nr:toxin [Mycobacterium phage Babsiella]YP_010088212.1 toxin [Mycobacterium phage HC]WRQ08791.1 HicA-like toxin [Mycobacterium phage mika]WRQ08966.1 HicA-like toxin [Mycobacterium phage ridax]AER48408.1 HicA-like toxin [Mycobacterium phage Babsiella]BBC53906.1 putative toxin-antitoxin system protein [Mycobacterium phage HC]